MPNKVTKEQIKSILDNAKIEIRTVLGKCTVVAAQLANGFIIIESSACVDLANYDEKLGAEICLERIENKLWELEGYKLQCELTNKPKLRIGVDVTNLDIHKGVLEVIQETIIDERLPKEYREKVVNRLGKVLGELQNKGVKKHSGPCTSATADGPCEKCGE